MKRGKMRGYKQTLLLGLILSFNAVAGKITMNAPEQSVTANGQTLCVYSNSIYTFTHVTKSKICPYTKTFKTEDAE